MTSAMNLLVIFVFCLLDCATHNTNILAGMPRKP
jgi:hypothetical protein